MEKVVNSLLDVFTKILPSSSATNTKTTHAVLATATSVVLVALPLWVIARKRRVRRPPYPPGPKSKLHFLLGNLLDLPDPQKEILDVKLLEWSKTYGLYFIITIPVMGPAIVVADPKLMKRVTITKNHPKSVNYKVLVPVVGNRSMLVLSGEEWVHKRKGFNPGFATSFLRNMVSVISDKIIRFVDCIEEDINNKVATNMVQRSQTFTSDVIVSVAFGEDWGGSNPHPARLWLSEIGLLLEGIFLRPLERMFGFVTMYKIRRFERLLEQEMRNILERRLAADSSGASAENAKDICSLAIKTIRSEDGPLTEEDKVSITHQLKTFYFAGHDTTAMLISWAMWLLSQHDTVLEKVRVELREHGIWADLSKPPTYEDLQKCTYLEATLKETLRLYPPVGIISRDSEDLDETYEGHSIGGAIFLIAIYTMHHSPALWNNPEEFRPERFLDGSEDNLSEKFVPFSRGPRDCIGKHFAMIEAKMAVSNLMVRYDVECVDPNESVTAGLTYGPKNGGKVKFHRRVL